MSLVENLINNISIQGLGGVTKPNGLDISDESFADLLQSQLNKLSDSQPAIFTENFGAPAGFIIEPIDGVEFAEIAQDQLDALGKDEMFKDDYINQPIEFKDVDMGDYFSNLLKANTDNNSELMNFAKKHAANAYNTFSRNFVMDLTEFVDDISSI